MKNENKPLIIEIVRFLDILQKNHFNQEKCTVYSIFGESKIRKEIIELCNQAGYIEGNVDRGWKITIKGIEFSEKHRENKTREEQTDAQNLLSFGILALAIMTGTISLIYYFFDLNTRGNVLGGLSIILAGIILMLIIMRKFKKLGNTLTTKFVR